MCGIDGAVRLWADAPPLDLDAQRRIRDAQARRGPDGPGEWQSADGRVVFGHRRLAILDLSPAGAQPMVSASGDTVVVNNGEIYNFRALRRELEAEGARLRTASDTEVILALYEREGRRAFSRLRGMFALALWDARRRRVYLVRDPLGIKPLYTWIDGGTLRFASQVKALEAGGLPLALDPAALVGFLLWGSVPDPRTIRRAARALPAGHLLELDLAALDLAALDSTALDAQPAGGRRLPEPEAFCPPGPWSPELLASLAAPAAGGLGDGAISQPAADAAVGSSQAAAAGSSAVLSPAVALAESVALHLESDVPVALFLSAGLDSSLLAALAAREARRLGAPLPTALTLRLAGTEGTPADEAPLAARTARQLGLPHEVRTLDLGQLATRFPEILAAMDQPSIDGANTFLISEVAHQAGFRVVLSGLGGDELFGSYPSFRDIPRLMRLAQLLRALPGASGLWRWTASVLLRDRPKLAAVPALGGDLAGAYQLRRGLFLPDELAGLLPADVLAEGLAAYDPLARLTAELAALAASDGAGAIGATHGVAAHGVASDGVAADAWLAVHHLETTCYMRHQLLRDSDWAAMAHSLELRVPLVDPWLRAHLAAGGFAPARQRGKAALVRSVAPELPAELFARPKSGFHVPMGRAVAGSSGSAGGSSSPGRSGSGERTRHGVSSRELARRTLAAWGVEIGGDGRRGARR